MDLTPLMSKYKEKPGYFVNLKLELKSLMTKKRIRATKMNINILMVTTLIHN